MTTKTQMLRRLAHLVLLLTLVCGATPRAVGAQTPAQIEANIVKVISSCRDRIRAKYNRYDVLNKLPPFFEDKGPSIRQLFNEETPNTQERELLIYIHDDIQQCQGIFIQEISKLGAEFSSLFSENYWEWTKIYQNLVAGQLTYGQFARASEEMRQHYIRKYTEIVKLFNQRYFANQAAQAQLRQNALTNLMNWWSLDLVTI